MKKILSVLLLVLCMTFTSCYSTTTATTSIDGFEYYSEYYIGGNYYPVVYVNSIPHYYYINEWLVVPSMYYHLIRHHNRPIYYRHTIVPPVGYHHYGRPVYHHRYTPTIRRPHVSQPNPRPNYRPQSRPNQYHPNGGHTTGPNNHSNMHRSNATPSRVNTQQRSTGGGRR